MVMRAESLVHFDLQGADEIQPATGDNARAALRMIREAVETLGPVGILPSEQAVLFLYGPEPVHEAAAIVNALTKVMGQSGGACSVEGAS